MKNVFNSILLLSLLTIIPIWIIPIAPIVDWPTHLAISGKIFTLLTDVSAQNFHYLDFSFLGYSLTHLLIVAFQYLFNLELSGQIVLSLIFLSSGLCWWYFFKKMDSDKQWFAIFGLFLNFSTYAYNGMVHYILAVNLGLIFLAFSIDAIKNNKRNLLAIFIFGALTYMALAYSFILCITILAVVFFYHKVWKNEKIDQPSLFIIFILILFSLINIFSNPVIERDIAYEKSIEVCVSKTITKDTYSRDGFFSQLLFHFLTSNLFPTSIFSSVFPLRLLEYLAVFIFFGLMIKGLDIQLKTSKSFKSYILQHLPKIKIKINKLYFAIFLILMIHFFILPHCVNKLCHLNTRSIPFALAFIPLAFSVSLKNKIPILNIAIALIIINSIFMGAVFFSQIDNQENTLNSLKTIANTIPSNSTVLIIPSKETSVFYFGKVEPLYSNLNYHALLAFYAPNSYISGLYTLQDTYILRSKFVIYDEMVHFGPNPIQINQFTGKNISSCYYPIPKEFDYYIHEGYVLNKN